MQKMDLKFAGILTKNKDNTIIPQDQWVVFLAKDNAFPATLEFYRQECIRQGASPEQVGAVLLLESRVFEWREAHPELCKTPDVEPGELLTTE